jgi:peptidoglycan/xylan/chitin deacetylase (PgdA/CDA1 family)
MHPAKRLFMVAVSLVYDAGMTCVRAIARRAGGHAEPVVMTYHAVRPEDVPNFERQMQHLSRRTTRVFPDDRRPPNGRPPVAVTFDDAFQSVFDNALPVMARHGIPATIFTPTGYLGCAAGWIERGGVANPPAVVSEDVLASANRTRVRFASHTVSHPHLASLDRGVLRYELAQSKRALEGLIGEPVTMLSLPYGSCSPPVLEEARAAGYERVFANVPVTRGAGPGLVGRINVTPADWPLEFRLKARGAYGWMALAVPAKRAVRALLERNRTE